MSGKNIIRLTQDPISKIPVLIEAVRMSLKDNIVVGKIANIKTGRIRVVYEDKKGKYLI